MLWRKIEKASTRSMICDEYVFDSKMVMYMMLKSVITINLWRVAHEYCKNKYQASPNASRRDAA